jgi:ABC-type iron transport system FetAB ATPase subunit
MTLLELREIARPGLEPVTFDLTAGSCCAIMGPSGSGKSLFLRAVADLDPHDGTAVLAGTACSAMSGPRWRRQVTYVAAEPGWWDDHVAPHMARPEDASVLARRLDLPGDVMSASIARLSTGERQRLALIRALVQEPKVLLLDEPTAALDQAAAEKVAELLVELRGKGLGLIVVTHDRSFADRIADRSCTMREGRLSEAAP